MDPAVEPREPGLVGRVVVRRRLKDHVLTGPALEPERAGLDPDLEQPAGEVRAPRVAREHLRSGAAEGAVPGDEAGERRRDEAGPLVGNPLRAEDPADAALLARVLRGPLPGPDRDLTDVAGERRMSFAGRA